MLRTAFPDLTWLKSEVARNLTSGRGWPSVIIQARPTAAEHRPDIRGPLSLFTNRSGASYCAVGRHRVRIEPDCYFLTNADEHYTLDVEEPGQTETFNIHFGTALAETVLRDLVAPTSQLLDEPFTSGPPVRFFNRLYGKDPTLDALLAAITRQADDYNTNALLREQLLLQVLAYLLGEHRRLQQRVASLPALRSSTRTELFRRLSVSLDYLYSRYATDLSLDELAGVACLSKFHYLRLFRAWQGQTPYAFLRQLRVQKARRLLRTGVLPVGEVGTLVGFDSSSSFCRAFRQCTGQWPQAYRQA
ncbi:helix-turn-helix transcriptional regulator [Hymenobacter sp. BT175]|uniref:helix-turn-helix domain-containing protein n=1 Tax=Hymenobacter translucens TaxID=2886507 RepID=UPI001D0DEFEB|nr:helix-turn-helix transcriptional regulator [Hymenobacter translucens]MCC2548441.1 helix-turn-helix transcriptional regulator [Hymenobacter translucens]